MNARPLFFIVVLLTTSSLASTVAAPRSVTPDVATQIVLKQYGLESEILRSFDRLEAESKRADGRFEFLLAGAPAVYVLLDRDYWVLTAWEATKGRKGSLYVLNPKDEQSALNITVDEGKTNRTGFDKSREPGFSGYSTGDGVLAGSSVSWRRCFDSKHLYSEATVVISLGHGAKAAIYTVHVDITANTEARRKALEDCLALLELRKAEPEKNRPNQSPEPTPGAVTPRATSRISEMKPQSPTPNPARGAPAPSVAHL
jgi:hypothetical protein